MALLPYPRIAELRACAGQRFTQGGERLLHRLRDLGLLRDKQNLHGRAVHVQVNRQRTQACRVQLQPHVMRALLHHLHDLVADLV